MALGTVVPLVWVHASPAPEALPTEIRVRITEGVSHVDIRGYDLKIYQTKKGISEPVAQIDKTSEWQFRCQEGKIRARQLHTSKMARVFDLQEPVTIKSPVGFLHYGEMPYRNQMTLYSAGLLCEVINQVSLEKYLDGLVNSEFSSHWNAEAVAAQVVAARTYAYFQILENRKKRTQHYDVDATIKDQVYNGSLKEDFHSSQIVEKTKGLILTSEKNGEITHPIKAFYHAACGGRTELPERVWGSFYSGFKKQVSCPFCGAFPKLQWELEISHSELTQILQQKLTHPEFTPHLSRSITSIIEQGRLLDLRFHTAGNSGRVAHVTSVWANGKNLTEVQIPSARFREWIGVLRFRSTAFQAAFHRTRLGTRQELSWQFFGRGNGHGVGMCQWGAKVMGEKGFKMAAILKHYYPDAILRKMW